MKDLTKLILTLVISLLVIVFQLFAATTTQSIETTWDFNNPYFLNYFGTSFLLLCFIFQFIYYLYSRFQYKKQNKIINNKHEQNEEDYISLNENIQVIFHSQDDIYNKGYIKSMEEATRISWKKLIPICIPLSILWFFANYFFAIALSMTNIASSMSLEQTTTIFVFILSVLILKETISIGKVLSVSLCIIGVIIIAIGDQLDTESTTDSINKALLGDILVLGSAICASIYMITYKKLLQEIPIGIQAVNSLLGLIGVWNILLFWPGLLILSSFDYEDYSNFSGVIIALTITSSIAGLAFNYSLNFGMVLTSPLFMRIVIICGVPASFIVNIIMEGLNTLGLSSLLRIIGATLIILGFMWFTYSSRKEVLKENNKMSQEEKEKENIQI